MTRSIALLDANVLYSSFTRDIFTGLASTGAFYGRWTDEIHQEWMRALRRNDPLTTPEKLERIRARINESSPDGLIVGYKSLIAKLTLPDPDDRHVLAAAIVGRCDTIVTQNLKDFPDEYLARYQIGAQTPDTFLMNQMRRDADLFCETIRKVRNFLRNPPYSVERYLSDLRKGGLAGTASALEKHAHLL
ncbi:MAG: PIN domain-containing protein [Alphaproteobacteria bacterium]|nr:PIN domain-containing protein [Alphaproteobacteria bacterium]MDA8004219.1 PIN domain-containing protein [Alphaproteobacteria bacterium]MDA8006001.1 PIN domain-containing protein [Alphaproteobacteria bacterium]MDA8013374.1 PIN domain-containing protein [Alphaproteobacteria bacterium]